MNEAPFYAAVFYAAVKEYVLAGREECARKNCFGVVC